MQGLATVFFPNTADFTIAGSYPHFGKPAVRISRLDSIL